MPWYNPQDFPPAPGAPAPLPLSRDYRWRVSFSVATQNHSSYISRDPGVYNGYDVSVGQWIANTVSGQAWQIITIESKSATEVVAIVQDVYRYNTFRDVSAAGGGSPNSGTYVVFALGDDGKPQIDPAPASGTSAAFASNLQSRFEYINLQYDYPLYQENNVFAVNDVIAVDSATHTYTLADGNQKVVVGRVTSISDTMPGWFTINPVQKVVDFLDYLPGDVGDIIYSSVTVPGGITTDSGGAQLYVKLRNNTSSVSVTAGTGPTSVGSVIKLNNTDVQINGSGSSLDLINAVNAVSSQTGVVASAILAPVSVSTSSAFITSIYGEPALFASAAPAAATINGVPVTFNITATDPGYEDYTRPTQMAQAINAANIPNIVASATSALVLEITNTAGGSITIANTTSDVNGVAFAGPDSGSGLALVTAGSASSLVQFTAVDSRSINFVDVLGSASLDFGLVSVENGAKAAGLYIEQGLRAASSTVVANLAQMNSLSPLIGDQAYVIDSDDGAGNHINEWSMWIFDGSAWVQTANQDSATTDAKSIEYTVNPASPTNISIGEISTGRRITIITVEVMVPFDTPAALSIGYLVNNPVPQTPQPAGLMTAGLVDLTVVGTYTTSTDILFGTDTVSGDVQITAQFTAASASVGSAQIIVSYV